MKRVLFLFGGVLAAVLLYVTSQAVSTLDRLEIVERERDQWQKPEEIVRALDLKEGAVVVDLGCGAGYFALKLAPVVGSRGKVLAVDLRRISLAFLWIRAQRRRQENISVILGDTGDPHLPENVDAVLVANTYHELANPDAILSHVRQALRPGGRLVLADRNPAAGGESGGGGVEDHAVPLAAVEQEVQRQGFEIVSRREHLLDQPGDGSWWLLAVRKP